MKASEIRKMSASELDTKLHDLKDELFKLGYTLDNISRDQVDEVRRLVDRISNE